jgi:ATP-dependent Zn protease
MDAIRADGPCIVFIDEIDLLNLNRDDHGKPNELLSAMLTWMGGEVETDPNKQMVIIAATNRPDKIDPALRQHGRFGEIIPFRYPTYDERLEFLVKKLNKNGIMLPMDMIKQIAQETDNRPYDDLEAIMNSALQLAFCEHRPVDQQDFQNALDQNVHHIANNCQALILTEQEIKIIAAHQAGHALATHLIQPTERISMITTEPINQPVPEQPAQNHSLYQPTVQHGITLTYPIAPRSQFHNQAQLTQLAQLALAGHIAQVILLDSCSYAYNKSSQERALELAMQITLAGLNINSLSKQNLAVKKDEAIALIEQLKRDTTQLLAANKAKLEQLYVTLLKQKTIREADFYDLVA